MAFVQASCTTDICLATWAHRLAQFFARSSLKTTCSGASPPGNKRGITRVYHHVSGQHLKRYVAEFDFRYNNRVALGIDDFARTIAALAGIKNKRQTHKEVDHR